MSIVATTPDISREIEPAVGAVLVAAPAEYQILPLDKVLRSRLNPRKHFDEAYIAELAESIKAHGQLQPIVVRPALDGPAKGFYDVIMGECRLRACNLAGLKTIKAIIRTDVLSDDHHIELALIENLHRRDIDPIEEANGYQQLAAMGYKQADICSKVNRSQAAVSNAMRLLKLPEPVTDLVAKGDLSVAHALAIVKYSDWPAVAVAIADYAVRSKVSSKSLESDNDLWQMWRELKEKKLVEDIFHSEPWEKPCKACPLNAYRGDQRGSRAGHCFRPDHYAELEAAHRAIADAKIAAETEALRKRAETNKRLADKLATGSPAGVSVRTDDNTKALHLRDLGYDKYERIRGEDVEGCSEACACRTVAIDHGGEPCRICIDPGHRRALKGQATRIDRIRIRKENQERQALWCKLTEAGYTRSTASVGFRRVLAILAWSYIRKASAEARRSVAKGLPMESLKGLLCAPVYSVKDIDAFQILEAQEPAALLAVLGSIDIEWEAKLCVEAANDKTPIADFLLAPAPETDPGSPKYRDCPGCMGLMVLKPQPDNTRRYECGCGRVQAAEGATA